MLSLGAGYFECARALGKYHGKADLAFWSHELKEVRDHWRE